MGDVSCTPGHHIGEDDEGRCSSCGDWLERPSPLLTVLVVVAVVLTTVTTVGALLSWWLAP
jgi:hypothetical protein